MHHSPEAGHINHVGVVVLLFILGSFIGYHVGAAYEADNLSQAEYDQNYFFGLKKKAVKTTPAKTTTTTSTAPATTTANKLVKGDFGSNGEYGTLQATGYPTIKKTDEAFCEKDCKQYDYVFFHVTQTPNTSFINYVKSLNGNAFAQSDAIGMGCLADSQISYSNDSDSKGMTTYTIAKDLTNKIMAATAEKPITLQLTRLKFSYGSGAPTCYSHFATFDLVN